MSSHLINDLIKKFNYGIAGLFIIVFFLSGIFIGDRNKNNNMEESIDYCIHDCDGNWNGDTYFIDNYYLVHLHPVGSISANLSIKEKLPLIKFVDNSVLDIWKKMILLEVSKDYFEKHFDVQEAHIFIGPDLIKEKGMNPTLTVAIYYNFRYDWAIATNLFRGARDRLVVAEKRAGKWQKLSEKEVIDRYKNELELEKKNFLGIAEKEFASPIISKPKTLLKFRACNDGIRKISKINFEPLDKDIIYAQGGAIVDASKCKFRQDLSKWGGYSAEDVYTVDRARVDLITGELTCVREYKNCESLDEWL